MVESHGPDSSLNYPLLPKIINLHRHRLWQLVHQHPEVLWAKQVWLTEGLLGAQPTEGVRGAVCV
jgi:hypothetical protein